jgi:hypothetical protein
MERLIVYETDKGNYAVRPEQWAGIIDKNGKIKECGLNHIAIFHYKKDAEWYADAKNAEEQGLLLRLPCKDGDTAYYVHREYLEDIDKWINAIDEVEVDSFVININIFANVSLYVCGERFGKTLTPYKTLFFTKEEAEQALAKMKEV